MNKFILFFAIILLMSGCTIIWGDGGKPHVYPGSSEDHSAEQLYPTLSEYQSTEQLYSRLSEGQFTNQLYPISSEGQSTEHLYSRSPEGQSTGAIVTMYITMPDTLCDWVRIEKPEVISGDRGADYELSYDFNSITNIDRYINPKLLFHTCPVKLAEFPDAKENLVRLLEYQQVSALLDYGARISDNSLERYEPLELAMIYEFYLTHGSLDTPRWWGWLTPEDQVWLEGMKPTIHGRWLNRFQSHPNIKLDNDPVCQRRQDNAGRPPIKPITKPHRGYNPNGRECYEEMGRNDFLGISEALGSETGPVIPIAVCIENKEPVDISGENVTGLIKIQLLLTQTYLIASAKPETRRGEIETYLIMLMVCELYLRDGESDNPIWWNMLKEEDQRWLNDKRQTIYDHWKVRLSTYK